MGAGNQEEVEDLDLAPSFCFFEFLPAAVLVSFTVAILLSVIQLGSLMLGVPSLGGLILRRFMNQLGIGSRFMSSLRLSNEVNIILWACLSADES